MLNNLVLVGRIEKIEKENNNLIVELAVSRQFKNQDGVYETDYIPCTIGKGIAYTVEEYCEKGDVIGVKGRLQSNNKLEVIAEKVSFLKSGRDE